MKDNICQEGSDRISRFENSSKLSSPYDATVLPVSIGRRLAMGRANCDEFAMGSTTETSAYKKTRNPWNLERFPGGSSGGSASRSSRRLVPWALDQKQVVQYGNQRLL